MAGKRMRIHGEVTGARRVGTLLAVVSLLLLTSSLSAQAFTVYDALLYQNKPDLTKQGLSQLRMIYDSELWPVGSDKEHPDFSRIGAIAQQLDPNVPVCVDIEQWPTTGKPEVVKQSVAKYKAVIGAFRRGLPSVKIGYYSVIPYCDYWRATKAKGQRSYDEWLRDNIKLKEISGPVDFVFPSLYAFYADQKGWETYAIENLKEAKKYGKPVYAFLWPEYHDSNPTLKGTYVPADYWRLELETCYKYADGIVIWGGWQEQWNENAPWWIETKKFLQKIRAK
jgi:hypothetical protein